jgi:alpha-beta hydrolase superfamily lysophospholipase
MKTPALPIMKTVFGVERNIQESDFPTDHDIQQLESMLPSSCVHGWFPSTYQNKQLHYRKWIPSDQPTAIVIFMHGISTHSVKYVKLHDEQIKTADATKSSDNDALTTARKVSSILMVETFLQNNIAVYSFDMYGHGYSEGIRFFIPVSYEVNVQDYISFCNLVAIENKESHKNAPIFLMGESYGSTLTLHVAYHFQQQTEPEKKLPNFDSIILTAPAIIGDLPIYPVVQLLTLLGKYYPTWRPFFMPNPVSPHRIWRDPLVRECYCDKSLPANIIDGQGIPFRLGTGVNLLRALEDVRKKVIPNLTVPYLVIHGTEDHGVPISGSEFLYRNSLTSNEEKEFIKKDLLADYVAEECMEDILRWINKRISILQTK